MYREYKIYIDSNADDVFNMSTDDYSKYLQLPFSINEKADETYDTASLTLNRTNRKEPFSPNTKVQIEIYSAKNVLINDGEPYSFIVEEDSVSKYYLGVNVYYKHELTLIERTKILDNILLPSFTVTQPKDAIFIRSSDIDTGEANTYYSTNIDTIYSSSSYNLYQHQLLYQINDSYTTDDRTSLSLLYVSGKPSEYSLEIDNVYLPNTLVPLPLPKDTNKLSGNTTYFELVTSYTDAGTGNSKTSRYTLASGLPKVYKVYLKYSGTEKYQGYITVNRDGSINKFSSSVGSSFSREGITLPNLTNTSFTITMRELLPNNSSFSSYISGFSSITGYSNFKAMFTSQTVYNAVRNLTKAYGGPFTTYELLKCFHNLFYAFTSLYSEDEINNDYAEAVLEYIVFTTFGEYGDVSLPDKYNESRHFKYFFGNTFSKNPEAYGAEILGNVSTFESTVDIEQYIYGYNGAKTIRDLMNKIIYLIDENCGSFSLYDSSEMSQLLGFPVPEKVYGSKTVSEILFELGKLINSYPYLNNNNAIQFKRVIPKDNPLFNDGSEEEKVNFNNEDNITTYVSDIQYMVGETEGVRSYWPDRDHFEYPNGSFSEASITADNAGITIQNSSGINELIYIKVKNCIENEPNTVIDITDYCLEKTVYDASYSYSGTTSISNRSKNNTFYWTKGNNFISFGALTSQMAVSIFGADAPEEYAIQRAIKNAAKIQLGRTTFKVRPTSEIVEFMFQVCYIDQMNGRIKTEKFNSTPGKKSVMSNNNQTENKISSIDWADVSQTDILRRGNLDLTKTVVLRNLSALPVLGEFKRDSSGLYYADSISYIFNNNTLTATINFTKDYSKINGNVAIYKDYRQYEIYNSDIVERSVNIDRYIYLSLDSPMSGAINSPINYTSQFLNSSNTSTRMKTPMYALVYFYKNSYGDPLQYNYIGSDGRLLTITTVPGILLPLSYAASGNSIILKTQFHDNFTSSYYNDVLSSLSYYDYWGGKRESSAKETKDVRYVDNFGEAAYYSIYLIKPGYEGNFFDSKVFPKTNVLENNISEEWILDKELRKPLFKDNKEKLLFIYQFHFLTNDNRIKWHPALCKYLFYDNKNQNELYLNENGSLDTSLKASIYTSYDDIKDFNYVNSSFNKVSGININESSDSINSMSYTASEYLNGYCIAYPKTQEILFHINKEMRPGVSYTLPPIYFNYFNKKQ